MKHWLVLLTVLGFVAPILGCAAADRDAPSASPPMSGGPTAPAPPGTAADAHAHCFRTGGTWHPDLSYCEYRAPDGTVPPMK